MLNNKDTKSFAVTRFKGITVLALFLLMAVTAPVQVIYAVQDNDRSLSALAQQIVVDRSDEVMTISLDINEMKLSDALEALTSEMGVGLSYSSDTPLDKIVTLQLSDVPFHEALYALLEGTNLEPLLPPTKDVLVIREKEEVSETEIFQETVRGQVTDGQTGEPLPGVNIILEGTDIGTVTNTDGEYSLNFDITDNAVIVYSYIGYQTQRIEVDSQEIINVDLSIDLSQLGELMVVGYGSVSRSDLTGSIERINSSNFENQSTTGLEEILSGTMAGVFSNQGTTAAGGGSLEIRGTTSLKASNRPLIVVDGVIYNGNINDINPADIEAIDVLKDASSAAVYGARSASGVVIVTTKKGDLGAPIINISAKTGIVGLTNQEMRPFGPDEYIQARIDNQRQTYNQPPNYFSNPNDLPSEISLEEWMNYDATPSDDPIDMWLNRLTLTGTEKRNYLAGNTVDWLDLIRQNGIRQDYDLSLSGGIEGIRYYWSGGFTNNQGYIIGDEFKTIRSRLNIDADVSDIFKIRLNTQFADRDQGFESASLNGAISGSPYGQIYSEDGEMNWYTHEEIVSTNPIIYHTYRDRVNRTQSLFATLSGELELPYGFSYTVSFVNRFSANRNYLFDPIQTPRGGQSNGYGSRSNSSIYEWQVDNIIKWYNTFSDIHELDFTFLVNFEKYQSWDDNQVNTQFAPTDALSFHAMGAGTNPSISSNDEYSTGNAFMGRMNYSLMSKYLVTMSIRRDGYSAFGNENPFAIFPSIAFAWRISEEDFFNIEWIDHLKVRTSWGVNGNRDIGRYEALARLTTVNYLYGNSLATGVYSNTMSNSSLKWERTEALNLGIDFGMFQDRLNASIDLYRMRTDDLLMDRTLPSIIGYSSVAANLGEVENKGLEITINSMNINIPGRFQWNSLLNFSLNRNKIISLFGDLVDIFDDDGNLIGQREVDDSANNWFIGESIYRIWDYERLGVWQLDEAAEAAEYGRRPGDIKLKDVNNDGVLNPADDKVFQGYRVPRYRLGFGNDISYSNFELSMFIRADLGFYRENSIDDESSWIDRRNIYNYPYWTPENPSNEYAMLNTEKDAPYGVWKNSSFIRLQDVSLSYTLPSDLLANTRIRNFKIFINLRNYYTITKWDSWDPESGRSPMPKHATFGVDISL